MEQFKLTKNATAREVKKNGSPKLGKRYGKETKDCKLGEGPIARSTKPRTRTGKRKMGRSGKGRGKGAGEKIIGDRSITGLTKNVGRD